MIFYLTKEQADTINNALSMYLKECYTDMEEMMDQEHKEFYQKVLGVYQDFQRQWVVNKIKEVKD